MTNNVHKSKHAGYNPPENFIGERIKQKRLEYRLSVEGLASLTALYDYAPDSDGVSAPTLYRYESGGSKPGAREIRLLSLALNVSPCWLITGEEWDTQIDLNADIARAVRVLFNQVLYEGQLVKTSSERDHEHQLKLSDVKMDEDSFEDKPD